MPTLCASPLTFNALNSDVIRAFATAYPVSAEPNISDIVNDEVDFYAHCVIKWGVRLGFWEKIGNAVDVGELNDILFRDTSDYGHSEGEEPIRKSNNWYVWHIGDDDFTRVGELEGENRNAEIGVVMDPVSIVERLKTGRYGGFYPDYE